MVEEGILTPVNEPTDWGSSMVTVVKSNKLRICIDPKDLNRAIKRSHYPMPTIEEVATKLSKAKVFTVLDAKSGFWQIKLDDESFNTLSTHLLGAFAGSECPLASAQPLKSFREE